MKDKWQHNILYSCTAEPRQGDDPFVPEHCLSYILSGDIDIHTDNGIQHYEKGALGLIKRNQLIKAVKRPGLNQPFLSVNIFLTKEILKRYSVDHAIKTTGVYTGDPNIRLPVDPFMKGYLDSLLPYFEHPGQLTPTLASLKTIEAIELLTRHPSLTNLLFDFSDPFKIDLEAYMNSHFTYNVPISQFAHLTGRSLSTFKRDFVKFFQLPPEKWLRKKRLDLAHYLLTQKHQRPSEVYLEVGFENFSHFSTSFKKAFGMSPAMAGQ